MSTRNSKTYRYYVLVILTLTYLFSYLDRQILSILIDDIGKDFAENGIVINDIHKGFLMGTGFALFYATLGIPIARLADRWNRRNIITVAIIVWSAFTALCGAAMGFWTLFLARVGVGVGEAGASPPAHSMIADYFKKAELNRALAIYTSATTFGLVTAFLAGTWVAEQFNWRTVFVAVAAPGILLGLLLLCTVKEPERGATDGSGGKFNDQVSLGQAIKSLRANKPYVGATIAHTLHVLVGYVVVSWCFPIYRRTFEMSRIETGQYLAAAILFGGLIGLFAGGYFSDRLGGRDARWLAWVPGIGVLLAAPLMSFSMFQTDPMSMTIWLGFGILFYNVGFSPAFGIVQTVVKSNERALASAIVFLLANFFGLGIGPLLAGYVSELLRPSVGAVSMNYALAITTLFLWLAFIGFMWTAGTLKGYKRDASEPAH